MTWVLILHTKEKLIFDDHHSRYLNKSTPVLLNQVAYLSFASWNDSRQEKEDQLRNNGTRSSNGNMNASRTDKDGAKKKAQAPKTSKGFGKK